MANLSRNADVIALAVNKMEGLTTNGELKVKPMKAGDEMTLLEIRYASGVGAPPHTHQHESLCYVVSGKVKMTVAGEEFVLGPGDVCLHPQGVLHAVEAVEDSLVVEVKSPVQPIEQFLGTSE